MVCIWILSYLSELKFFLIIVSTIPEKNHIKAKLVSLQTALLVVWYQTLWKTC